MSSAGPATKPKAAAPGTADARGIALGYEPPPERGGNGKLWIPAGGSHRVVADHARTARLRDIVLDLTPEPGARLVVLGNDVGALRAAERTALRSRIAFLPTDGGLISHLNCWENVILPLAIHHPKRVRDIAGRVLELLAGLGTEPHELLAKIPEEMTLYEKKAAGYVRILLEAPELVLAEDIAGGLDAFNERGRAATGFAAAYHAVCAGGTFVQLEYAPDT